MVGNAGSVGGLIGSPIATVGRWYPMVAVLELLLTSVISVSTLAFTLGPLGCCRRSNWTPFVLSPAGTSMRTVRLSPLCSAP